VVGAQECGRDSAKRLLSDAFGYSGSASNFRRLVTAVKTEWRCGHHRGRRPGRWTPEDALIIDWQTGQLVLLHLGNVELVEHSLQILDDGAELGRDPHPVVRSGMLRPV
jgi:hypothetical protein